jgi:hypothetical protein
VWEKSLLADHDGTVEAGWLEPFVTAAAYFAPFVRHATTYIQPVVRAEFEAATLEPSRSSRPARD